MDKAIKKEKTVEAVLGLLFILPAMIGVIYFIVDLCPSGNHCDLDSLRQYGPNGVYFGLMAIAGAYMLKNSLRYLFLKKEKPKEEKKPAQ